MSQTNANTGNRKKVEVSPAITAAKGHISPFILMDILKAKGIQIPTNVMRQVENPQVNAAMNDGIFRVLGAMLEQSVNSQEQYDNGIKKLNTISELALVYSNPTATSEQVGQVIGKTKAEEIFKNNFGNQFGGGSAFGGGNPFGGGGNQFGGGNPFGGGGSPFGGGGNQFGGGNPFGGGGSPFGGGTPFGGGNQFGGNQFGGNQSMFGGNQSMFGGAFSAI